MRKGVVHVPSTPLTPAQRLAVSRGLGGNEPTYWARHARGTVTARNGREGISARFMARGVSLSAPGGSVALSLVGFGAATASAPGSGPPTHRWPATASPIGTAT